MANNGNQTMTFSQRFCKVPLSIPQALQSLLSTVKNVNLVSTAEEVLDAIKDYIYKNELYDRANPRLIHCENDALKDVLGVPQFTLYEIKRIVLALLLKENRNNIKDILQSMVDSAKRKAEDSSDDESKRVCLEKSETDNSAPNSQLHQNEEIHQASSDEWSCFEDNVSSPASVIAVNHTYDIEYEIETDSSAIKSVTDSDSEIEDIIHVAAVSGLLKTDSDVEFWADRSSDELCDDDSDIEISDADKWVCKTCGGRNKPMMRYCLKCWEERQGWANSRTEKRVPPRSKGKKKVEQDVKKLEESKSPAPVDEKDCEPGPSQESMFSSSQDSVEASDRLDLCSLCFKKPKNASIVHGNIGHQFCCYRCARKLLSLNKPCPICRKGIERVIHNFIR